MLSATSRSGFGLLLAALLMAGGGAPVSADDAVLVFTPQTKSYLDQYLRTRQPLAFAVSADGTRSGYVYCEDYGCRNIDYRNQALGLCTEAGGRACKILAVGQQIKLAYRVDPSLGALQLLLPKLDQPRTPPCVGKSESECQAIVAEFDARRRQIDAKWAQKTRQWHQSLCNWNGGFGSRPCRVKMAELEEQRDVELKALDEEFRAAMVE